MADRLKHLPPIRKPEAPSQILDILQQVRNEASEDAAKNETANTNISPATDAHMHHKEQEHVSEEAEPSNEKKKMGPQKKNASLSDMAVKLEGDNLWEEFVNLCSEENALNRTCGYEGTCSMIRIDKDLVATLKECRVYGYTGGVLINSILRTFIIHYKEKFASFKKEVAVTSII